MDKTREAALKDVVDRIVRRVRDSEYARRMVERVTRFFHTHDPSDDLTRDEVRELYRGEDYGDEFDVGKHRELDVGWTNHAEYRSELRDVDPSRVNEAVRDFADAHQGPGGHRKITLNRPGMGKAVVDVDLSRNPEQADVITVMAKRTANRADDMFDRAEAILRRGGRPDDKAFYDFVAAVSDGGLQGWVDEGESSALEAVVRVAGRLGSAGREMARRLSALRDDVRAESEKWHLDFLDAAEARMKAFDRWFAGGPDERVVEEFLGRLEGRTVTASELPGFEGVRQSGDFYCGAAAVEAVLGYYGVCAGKDEVAEAAGTDEDGTDNEGVVRALRGFGMEVTDGEGMSLDEVRGHLDMGHPVVMCVWMLPEGIGHYVVAVGHGEGTLVLEDPRDGRVELSDAEMEEVRYDDGERMWGAAVEGPSSGGRTAARTKYKSVEPTAPGSKNHYKITYHDGKEKWTDQRPGRGMPSRREHRVLQKELENKPSMKRPMERLDRALENYRKTEDPKPLQRAVEKTEVGLDRERAKTVNRMFVRNVKKEEGKGIDERTKDGLQVVKDHVNRNRRDAGDRTGRLAGRVAAWDEP